MISQLNVVPVLAGVLLASLLPGCAADDFAKRPPPEAPVVEWRSVTRWDAEFDDGSHGGWTKQVVRKEKVGLRPWTVRIDGPQGTANRAFGVQYSFRY